MTQQQSKVLGSHQLLFLIILKLFICHSRFNHTAANIKCTFNGSPFKDGSIVIGHSVAGGFVPGHEICEEADKGADDEEPTRAAQGNLHLDSSRHFQNCYQ